MHPFQVVRCVVRKGLLSVCNMMLMFVCIASFFYCVGCCPASEVLIYNDDGVDQGTLLCTQNFFKERGYRTELVDANFLKERTWISRSSMLVIPGGADCQYHKKLQGVACSNIKQFVQQGGTYVGICAGGYFGCERVKFAVGTWQEVDKERELAFSPGPVGGLF